MGAGDFFKTVGKVAFPFISTAAQAGGPFTAMAAAAVGKALGIDKLDPSTDGIAQALGTAMLNPEQRAALIEAEHDFQLEMAKLNIAAVQDIEQIAAEDRASARNREIQVKDRTPQVLAYCLVAGFFIALGLLFKYPIPGENKATVFTMIGSLGTLTIMAATYYYGTTVGSNRKTELLAQAPAIEEAKK